MQVKGYIKYIKSESTKTPDLYRLGLLIGKTMGDENPSWYNTITKYPDNYQKGQHVMFLTKDENPKDIKLGTLKVVKGASEVTEQKTYNKSSYTKKTNNSSVQIQSAKLETVIRKLDSLEERIVMLEKHSSIPMLEDVIDDGLELSEPSDENKKDDELNF